MSRKRGYLTIGSVIVPLLALLLVSTAWAAPRATSATGKEPLAKPTVIDHKNFDGNTINSIITNDGSIVDHRVTGSSGMEWPKGTDKLIDYHSGLWLVGIGHDDGQIYTACNEYSSELVPGNWGEPQGEARFRIYKINKGEEGTGDWLEWPVDQGAPVDENGDPLLLGDQTLFYVCNDGNAPQHANVFSTPPMDVEIRVTIFGYNRADPLGNVMFIKWEFVHKGTQQFDSCFVALWDDPDLGDASDDLVGCDPDLGLGYCYNGLPVDSDYGDSPPALGFDFFQGPEVPKGSGNYLSMTSFAWYWNGAPDPFDDPEIASEAYWFMNGYTGDGTPYTDPLGNVTSPFPLAGDPVSGAGDVDGVTQSPGDRRFLMSSGPFTLAPGDTQVVMGAKIIAQATTARTSVAMLKFYDAFAQTAYDGGFQVPSPEAPTVEVAELDQGIVLSWDEDHEVVESYSFAGYDFEGYNVYQGESVAGPWHRVATFDVINDFDVIFDQTLDPVTMLPISLPAMIGSNSGLKRFIILDEDILTEQPFSNYRRYYFAVTAYLINPDPTSIPRVVESAKDAFMLFPQEQFEQTAVSVAGESLFVDHPEGTSDGSVVAIVLDPTITTGHDYEVTFYTVDGEVNWRLTDTTADPDAVVVEDQTNQSGDWDYPIVDGLMVKVMGPPAGMKDWDVPQGTRRFTWGGGASGWGLEGFEGAMGWWQPATWWGSGYEYPAELLKNVLLVLATVDTVGNTVGVFDPNDPNVSYGYRYLRNASQPPAQPEFAPFIVNPGPGYAYQDFTKSVPLAAYDYEDPDNPRRLAVGHFENNVVGGMVDGKYWPPDYTFADNTAVREFLYIFDVDYSETPDPALEIENTNDMPIMWSVVAARRGNVQFSPDFTGQDQFLILANHINATADVFAFASEAPATGTQIEEVNLDKINVVPNPYFAFNPQERIPTNRFVTFTHLPGSGATIRIFTLSGSLVKTIDDAEREDQGTAGTPMAEWDLRNEGEVPVASGMYIAHIEVDGVGDKILKLAVFVPEERLDYF